MVQIKSHGGSCCGARHIHGFGTGDAPNNIIEMHNHAASAPDRLTEIILNKDQCRASPRLLAAMAERGYVLTTGFKNGNHDSDVFVFHRSDRRLRLDNVNRDFGFEWNGQLASPTLHGNLAALTPVPIGNGNNTPIPVDHTRRHCYVYQQYLSRYPRGMVLRYAGPAAHLQGATFSLPTGMDSWRDAFRRTDSGYSALLVVQHATGVLKTLSIDSLRIEEFNAPPAPQEHPEAPRLGNQRYTSVPWEGLNVPVVEPERVVYTTYHNVYRDGRIGAGYPTSQEARNAAPRAAQRLTRNIYNTGRVEDIFNGVRN